jgi:hypothetical protein
MKRGNKVKKVIFILFGVVILLCCGNPNSSESQLKKRVISFYELMKQERFESSWEFLMKASKESWKKDNWAKLWNSGSLKRKMLDFEIETIQFEKLNARSFARVKVNLKVSDLSSKKIYTIENESEWVFESGDWYRFEDI